METPPYPNPPQPVINRMFSHYRALRKSMRNGGDFNGWGPTVWMPLARRWKMPIWVVKEIIATEKEKRNGTN